MIHLLGALLSSVNCRFSHRIPAHCHACPIRFRLRQFPPARILIFTMRVRKQPQTNKGSMRFSDRSHFSDKPLVMVPFRVPMHHSSPGISSWLNVKGILYYPFVNNGLSLRYNTLTWALKWMCSWEFWKMKWCFKVADALCHSAEHPLKNNLFRHNKGLTEPKGPYHSADGVPWRGNRMSIMSIQCLWCGPLVASSGIEP